MLKVNLLPPYIHQRSKIRTAWTFLAVLLAAELAALTLWQVGNISAESQKLLEVQDKEQQVNQVKKLAADAAAKRQEIEPIKAKTDFINGLLKYNRVRPDLYERVASYIYREVWIQGLQAEQNVMTMPAQANSISAVGRFLLFMQNSPDFSRVQISSVPGWPSGTAGVEAGGLTGDSFGGGPGGPAGSGYGGPPGGPPGGGYPGGGGSGGGYSAPGGPPGYGTAPEASGYPGGAPPIFGGGGGPGEAPGLLQSPGVDPGFITTGGAPIPLPSAIPQEPPPPAYFGFTVTALLTKPIERPTYGGGVDPQDPGGYGGYGYGGMYPGGSGGYGSGYGGPPGGPPGAPPGIGSGPNAGGA